MKKETLISIFGVITIIVLINLGETLSEISNDYFYIIELVGWGVLGIVIAYKDEKIQTLREVIRKH